jgi:acyl-CoA dehydrogenase
VRACIVLIDLSPEQQQLKETVHRFAVEEIIPVAAEYDKKEDLPLDVCRKAWELGFLNPQISTEYGGLGLGVMDTCLIDEEMIYGCAGIALNMVANNLAALPLLIAGNEAQKKKYLGWLVEEPAYGAFALTEPCARLIIAALKSARFRLASRNGLWMSQSNTRSNAKLSGRRFPISKPFSLC